MSTFHTTRLVGAVIAGLAAATLAPNVSPAHAVTPSSKPMAFATTNGDILTTSVVAAQGTRGVVIGGNFSQLTLPNGTKRSASNVAILDLNNPNRVLYAGTGVNSFVRESAVHGSTVYLGGEFTMFGGQTRTRLAAVDASTGKVTAWRPTSSTRVEAMAAGPGGVYFAGRAATAVSRTTGAHLWSVPAYQGDIRSMVLTPGGSALYVGGLFEQLGSSRQHGLVKLATSTGKPMTAFAPRLRPDTVGGNGYDGDCVLALTLDRSNNTIVIGAGSSSRNRMIVVDSTTGSGAKVWGGVPYRRSEGDVQAVAVVGGKLAMGYHRNHGNAAGSYATKRHLTLWTRGGALVNYDLGLWGNAPNTDKGNGGVQAMTYDATSKKLIVAGAFYGWGDYSSDPYGKAGQRRQSLIVVNVS